METQDLNMSPNCHCMKRTINGCADKEEHRHDLLNISNYGCQQKFLYLSPLFTN